MSYNEKIIGYEKNLKNRINKKYGKTLRHLSQTDLHFESLNDEIKFLNQLYFLHQSIQNLETNLDGINEILKNIRNKENITLEFTEQISEDNQYREIINQMLPQILL